MQASIMSLTRQQALRLTAALFAPLLLAAALIPVINAQLPPPPHWFWGWDYDAFSGAVVVALDQDGEEVDRITINAAGEWELSADPRSVQSVTFELRASAGVYLSGEFTVEDASIDRLVLEDDFVLQAPPEPEVEEPEEIEVEEIGVRIIARRAEDNRIEFGMRNADGQEFLPPARFFPAFGPGHSRWLSSTPIDFGDGFVGRIIARYADDGEGCTEEEEVIGNGCRTEFGFRVEGFDDIFPPARFFPNSGGPGHGRWLQSSEIEIQRPAEQ